MHITEEMYENLYESYAVDNFKKTEGINSKFCHGDLAFCKNPRISFVIPAYSRVKELSLAINSILNQKELFPYEIVVVDDAPDAIQDNPRLDLIKSINNPHILYYANEKNLGVEGNWNRCISLARAPYVSMLHDDDLLSPHYMESIEKCLRTLERHAKKFGVIQAKSKVFFSDDDYPELEWKNRGGLQKISKLHCLYIGKGPVSPPSCGTLFNRQAVLEMGGFNGSYFPCADYLLGFFMVHKGYDCYYSEDDFGWYRFGINESVKPEVIQNTIKCNYFFLHWLYRQSLFNRIWSFFLGKAHISILVDGYNAARKSYCNFDVPKEMDAFIHEYGTHRLGRKLYDKSNHLLVSRLMRIFTCE